MFCGCHHATIAGFAQLDVLVRNAGKSHVVAVVNVILLLLLIVMLAIVYSCVVLLV